MKNYTITVNGNVYDVVVEEGASTGAPVAAKAPAAAHPSWGWPAATDFFPYRHSPLQTKNVRPFAKKGIASCL